MKVPGKKTMPDIFDDGDMNLIEPKKLKALLDVGMASMSKERWGAAVFRKNQLRIACENKWDPAAEPGPDNKERCFITHAEFCSMVRPAMHQACTPSDLEAVCKRASFIVNSSQWV